jgi:hypothetical protein
MWRIGRRFLVPAIWALLIAGLLVPAGAAPPKAFKPVWTLTQQYDAQGQKTATLKGVVSTDPKANYRFWVRIDLATACHWVNGNSQDCNSVDPCEICEPLWSTNWEGLFFPNYPGGTDTGPGRTATVEVNKSGTLTVTIVLTETFFDVDSQYVHVGVEALSLKPDVYPYLATNTVIDQFFY